MLYLQTATGRTYDVQFSTNLLETLWAYAHYTNDWNLIKERWDMIKKFFCTTAKICRFLRSFLKTGFPRHT